MFVGFTTLTAVVGGYWPVSQIILGPLLLYWTLVKPGDPGENHYGSNPLEKSEDAPQVAVAQNLEEEGKKDEIDRSDY